MAHRDISWRRNNSVAFGVKRTGTNLEITYAPVEIAAGFKAGRHNHPAVVIGHVLGGDFWLVFDGQPEKVLHAGDSLVAAYRAGPTQFAG